MFRRLAPMSTWLGQTLTKALKPYCAFPATSPIHCIDDDPHVTDPSSRRLWQRQRLNRVLETKLLNFLRASA